MYYSITFVNEAGVRKNTWDDWHIVPSSRPVIEPPEPKTSYVDIPGGNGSIDFTAALVPYPLFKDREGTFEFIVLNGYNIWHQLYSDIMTFLNGQKVKLYLEETPDYYYEGRITIDEWDSKDHPRSKIKMKYRVSPFQIGNDKVTKQIAVNGNATMVIRADELDSAPVSPVFTIADGVSLQSALTPVSPGGLTDNWKSAVYDGTNIVYLRNSDTQNIIVTSPNATNVYDCTGANTYSSIAHAGDKYFLLQTDEDNYKIMYSSDCINWNTYTFQTMTGVANIVFGNGLYLACSLTSTITATSTDGVTWTEHAQTNFKSVTDLIYAFNKFIAMAMDDYGNQIYVYSSNDGVLWSEMTIPQTAGVVMPSAMTYHNNRLMAPICDINGTYANSYVLSTTDGMIWEKISISADVQNSQLRLNSYTLYDSCFCDPYYIVVGARTGIQCLFVSTDGREWTQLNLSADGSVTQATHVITNGADTFVFNIFASDQQMHQMAIAMSTYAATETRVYYNDNSLISSGELIAANQNNKFSSIVLYGSNDHNFNFIGNGQVTVEIEKRRL